MWELIIMVITYLAGLLVGEWWGYRRAAKRYEEEREKLRRADEEYYHDKVPAFLKKQAD